MTHVSASLVYNMRSTDMSTEAAYARNTNKSYKNDCSMTNYFLVPLLDPEHSKQSLLS